HRAGEDVRADLRAFLEDADRRFGAALGGELLQPDRTGQPGGAGAHDDHVVFHRFAFGQGLLLRCGRRGNALLEFDAAGMLFRRMINAFARRQTMMKKEEGRLVRTDRVPMRWGEMDALGHMNNVSYFRFFEQARISWFESLGIDYSAGTEGPILG